MELPRTLCSPFANVPLADAQLSPDLLESCYTPIIQSGGNFNLKPTAASNGDNLFYGECLCCVRVRPASHSTSHLDPARWNAICNHLKLRCRCYHVLVGRSIQVVLLQRRPHIPDQPHKRPGKDVQTATGAAGASNLPPPAPRAPSSLTPLLVWLLSVSISSHRFADRGHRRAQARSKALERDGCCDQPSEE